MTPLSTVLWVTVVLMMLSNHLHALRRSSRNRGARSRSRAELQWWVPQVVEGQLPQPGTPTDPWLPVNVVSQFQTQQYADPWVPQQIPSSIPRDTWVPLETEQRPQTGNCTFIYDSVPEEHIHPFLVDSRRQEFVYPDIVLGQQRVTLARGTTVIASCPGRGNRLVTKNRRYVYITCRNSRLYRGKTPVSWENLGCLAKIKPKVKPGKSCGTDSRTHVIGWAIRRRLFLRQITVCFNAKLETTAYTAHTLHGRFIDAKVVEPSRPSFKTNSMFSARVQNSYTKKTQKSMANQLLQSTEPFFNKYQHYFARGHLAPDADFVLEAEQDATYFYVNVVPQWQAVNNGNWKRLECAVRELAERRQATFKVYTGTHGILELPDLDHHPTKMFLSQSSGKKLLPVPALLWKVIHDPADHTAAVIIVINDVTERVFSESYSLSRPPCSNVCSFLAWVDWDIHDVTKGQTFCCTVDDLHSTIPNIPALGRVGLLV